MCFVLLSAACAKLTPAVNVCFSPDGNCLSSITAEIENAKTEIRIQAYSLSSKPIADAVVNAKEAGINVEIILDKASPVAQNNAVYFDSLKGIPTYLDAKHAVADNLTVDCALNGSTELKRACQEANQTPAGRPAGR